MEEVRKGDLLFHGDEGDRKGGWGLLLTTTGWACAMCHPLCRRHPPQFVSEVPGAR